MLNASGKLINVKEDNYANAKTGELVPQSTLIIMDEKDEDTTKVTLSAQQIKGGAAMAWDKLKGKQVSVNCHIFSFKNGGFKINAFGDGLPASSFDLQKIAS